MLPAVGEFLKGGIGESFKKLIQPAAVVPASVFVILNLVFIYPVLEAAGVGLAAAFKELDETWKVALLGLITLSLGYVLLSLSSSTLRGMTGEMWSGSWLAQRLIDRQKESRKRLAEDVRAAFLAAPGDDARRSLLSWEINRLPPSNYLLPTDLGNVLNGAAHSIYRRYGMDLSATWPPLASLLSKESETLKAQIDDEKSILDLLLNLGAVLVAFGVEGLAVFGVLGNWSGIPWTLLAFVVAYVAYRAGVVKAQGWVDAIESAYDLHRTALYTKLGLRKFDTPSEARTLWRRASEFLLFDKIQDDIFPAPDPKSAVVVTSGPNLQVQTVRSAVTQHVEPSSASGQRVKTKFEMTYVFIVTTQSPASSPTTGQPTAVDGFFVVSDTRLPSVKRAPSNQSGSGGPARISASLVPSGTDTRRYDVLWQVARLPSVSSVAIVYSVPVSEVHVIADHEVSVDVSRGTGDDQASYEVTLASTEPSHVTVSLHDETVAPDTAVQGGFPGTSSVVAASTASWSFDIGRGKAEGRINVLPKRDVAMLP